MSKVLARRADAVRSRDRAAFLATVDHSRQELYAAQATEFANLEALPVTSLSYALYPSTRANPEGISGKAFTKVVIERVFFGGTDERPVVSAIDETFSWRSGHWLLAADSLSLGSQSSAIDRPWAGPPLAVVHEGGLIVISDQDDAPLAQSVAGAVSGDIRSDTLVLQIPENDKIMVDASTSTWVDAYGSADTDQAVVFAPPARVLSDKPTAGMRLALNPQDVRGLISSPNTLRFYLTRFLMYRYIPWNPTWLTFGLDMYVAYQPDGLEASSPPSEVYSRLMRRPHELTVSGVFGDDGETDSWLAWACVTYLVDHGGIERVKTLMADYAAYHDQPFEDSHTGELLQKDFGISSQQLADGAFDLLAALH